MIIGQTASADEEEAGEDEEASKEEEDAAGRTQGEDEDEIEEVVAVTQ